jgi:NAD-dependent dihydropyrimidine dehydrogenase PreA subunit
MAELGEVRPARCRPEPTGNVPVVDRNRCEAKDDCVRVCPYGVFEVRALTTAERSGVSIRGWLNLLVHRNRQAVVARRLPRLRALRRRLSRARPAARPAPVVTLTASSTASVTARLDARLPGES